MRLTDLPDDASRETIEAVIDGLNTQYLLERCFADPTATGEELRAADEAYRVVLDVQPAAARLQTYPWYFRAEGDS